MSFYQIQYLIRSNAHAVSIQTACLSEIRGQAHERKQVNIYLELMKDINKHFFYSAAGHASRREEIQFITDLLSSIHPHIELLL